MSNFAFRVIKARTDKGWSQEDLAKQSGMSVDAIEYIESGQARFGRKYPQLADALGVSLDWLATGQEKNSSSAFVASASVKGKEPPSADSVSARLRMALTNKGWLQADLVKNLGINQSTLSHLERGRNASSRRIDDIAKALGVSKIWLLTGKEDGASITPENAIKQRLLNAIERLPIEQLEHLVSIAEALGRVQKNESIKTESLETFQKHPLLQSDNAVVKRRKPPAQGRIKKAS